MNAARGAEVRAGCEVLDPPLRAQVEAHTRAVVGPLTAPQTTYSLAPAARLLACAPLGHAWGVSRIHCQHVNVYSV